MDCSVRYGNHSCFGGFMDNAFKYAIDYNIEHEEVYAYLGKVDAYCAWEREDYRHLVV